MAKLQLNGKKISIKSNISIFDLLVKYKLTNKKVAVELNGKLFLKQIIKKKNWKIMIRLK